MDIEFRSCLYFTVTRLSRLMEETAVRSFWGIGFSPSQAFLQMYINEHSGTTLERLVDAMHLPLSSIERYVDQLMVMGYLRKEGEGIHQTIFPTESGSGLNVKLRDGWQSLYSQLCKELGGEEAYRHLLMAATEVLEIKGK